MDLNLINNRERIHDEALPSSSSTVHGESEALIRTRGNSLDEFGTAFATAGGFISKDIGMLWPPVSGGIADYQAPIAPQYLPIRPPSPPAAPIAGLDEMDAAEASLHSLLALASAVGLPRQIEREEAAKFMV
ncbi:hypothetical protein KC19_2G283500 [Ceratodon purpureus]|uniref:Uncharacterized protein n=1 Tax=Ceratodon purpureus TaxID=3225 RepID=A0A8T0J291_CERPU|nr:hypothetical protein KC19_2G283500 [Ceratodon purpureus]